MTFSGIARRMDIGTGIWVLESRSEKVTLYGTIPLELEGKRVVVDGKYIANLGLGMLGGRAVQVAGIRLEE